MTVSILETLAVTSAGEQGLALGLGELGVYLAEHCNTEDDKKREKRHRVRDNLLQDGWLECLKEIVCKVFKDQRVKDLRLDWAPYAGFTNPMKRIVTEVSRVYSEPATRMVQGEGNQAAYKALLEVVQFDQVMQEANRLYNAHRAILVGFRVRKLPGGAIEPVVDVVTPSSFRIVRHPIDPTLVVGYLIRTTSRPGRGAEGRRAAWILWTDHEYVTLDESFMPFSETYVEHGFGVCPYVPIIRSVGRLDFWPGSEGEDLVAATVAVLFANLLLLKETKSATKVTTIAGDLAGIARGQAADSEVPSEMPEGTSITTVDMSMDLALFRDTSDHILEGLANDYGMSAAVVKHQGVQSGEARELMRIPLRELRREQEPIFRLFERKFVLVMVSVLKGAGAADQAFLTDGWTIDFGEAQTPMTPTEEVLLFEKERAASLDNAVDFLKRRNPDLDEDQARAAIMRNIDNETWRMRQMRELQALSGALSELASESFGAAPAMPGAPAPAQQPVSEGQAA